MFFGIANAQMAFINLMNGLFWNFLDSFKIVFINDILVSSNSKGDHMDHLTVVLQVPNEHQLFSKYRKCIFWMISLAFLGHIISIEGIEVDLWKTVAINNQPRPLAPTDIRSFLGLARYNREFICIHCISFDKTNSKEVDVWVVIDLWKKLSRDER